MRCWFTGVLVAGVSGCTQGAEETRFDWDSIGREFCQAATAEEVGRLKEMVTPELWLLLERAEGRVPARLLLQGLDAEAKGCSVRTRNAALVEIRRNVAGEAGWIDMLVMVPEADGSTRIDDILFETRPSDTLRARLGLVLGS